MFRGVPAQQKPAADCTMVGMDEYREIVSDILTTTGGAEAWIETNLAGYLTKRCTGCDLDEDAQSWAQALAWLAEHATACTVRR
jgi:hypothetical protein